METIGAVDGPDADGRAGVEAAIPQNLGQHGHGHRHFAAAVVDDARIRGVARSEQARVARARDGGLTPGVLENDAIVSQSIDVRRQSPVVAIATEKISALGVDDDQDDIVGGHPARDADRGRRYVSQGPRPPRADQQHGQGRLFP